MYAYFFTFADLMSVQHRFVLGKHFSVGRSSIWASFSFLKGLVNYHVLYIIVLATDPVQAGMLDFVLKDRQ